MKRDWCEDDCCKGKGRTWKVGFRQPGVDSLNQMQIILRNVTGFSRDDHGDIYFRSGDDVVFLVHKDAFIWAEPVSA